MFGGFKDMKKRTWFAVPEVAGGGASMDTGSHSLDLVRHFCGEVKRASLVKANLVQDLEVDDASAFLLELQSGAMAMIITTWSVPVPSTHYIEIYGSEGTILIGGGDSRYRLSGQKEWTRIEGGPKQLGAQMGHFVECIENKAAPLLTGIDGLRVQEIIHAAYKSHCSGKWEAVERTLG
jgi:predicted dehydrogenase